MATFKSFEDLAALQKQMKQEKEAKAKLARSKKDDDYVYEYNACTYNPIDKNVLKELAESQSNNSDNSSHNKKDSVAKQDRKSKKKQIRKLERKGLSRNAIKSMLRPRLTLNEEVVNKDKKVTNISQESTEDRSVRLASVISKTGQNAGSTTIGLRKVKVCKLCGKTIMGDVLKHYEEKHFSIYVANKAKIESHPGAFAVSEEFYKLHNESRQVIASSQSEKPESKTKKLPWYDKKKMREVIKALDERPEEQTYRGFVEFKCDACSKIYKHGKVIYSRLAKYHLCYECYKHARGQLALKRGNRHVFINTPM